MSDLDPEPGDYIDWTGIVVGLCVLAAFVGLYTGVIYWLLK